MPAFKKNISYTSFPLKAKILPTIHEFGEGGQ